MMAPTLILINPWIYDFAAYDLWSKPMGLLYIAGYLRGCGFKIHLIDCLDVHHPEMTEAPPLRRPYGTGKYWRKRVSKPTPLKHVSRPYSRYGIGRQLFITALREVQDPAAILVTSLMTYWYPGVREVISAAKKIHPGVPLILGGLYARLCRGHALRFSGADHVFSEGGVQGPELLLKSLGQWGISPPLPERLSNMDHMPYPAFDLLTRLDYVCLITSTGCPYRCRYCACPILNPDLSFRDPFQTLEEIGYWHREHGVRDFAFYDDALLFQWETRIGILLEHLIKLDMNIRFHTPNALHVREITPELAKLLYHSGFRTIRLGLETSEMGTERELDRKVSKGEFEKAVSHLLKAGYRGNDIGAYILIGLPGQSVQRVIKTIKFVGRAGAMPYLAEYSPIPQTPLWEEAVKHSSYDISAEPLFHNNTLLPCWDDARRERLPELKARVLEMRRRP